MIRKETLDFLKKLKKNNNRAWFRENRAVYEEAYWNIADLTVFFIDGLRSFDSSIGGLDPKDCIFRLMRDTRFSPDKTPYKPNFGVFIKNGGRRTPGAGYYLHVEPGSCMISGGIYMPPTKELAAIRSSIAQDPEPLRSILHEPVFAEEFGHLWGDTVKTAPRGYAKDHPAIDLLRHKHYIVGKEFTDDEIIDESFPESALDSFRRLLPFNSYLNNAMK
jgi:uncharacterized protein (TIGR02453 family)